MGAFAKAFSTINTRADVERELAANRAVEAGYLCGECSEMLGGRWPKGHRATFHPATCPICKLCRPLACWSDWEYPAAPKVDRWAKTTREI